MQYVITGSLGNTSKPITEALIQAGHRVTVITSREATVAAIEALGAQAAVGSVEDADFLKQAFAGADAAYLMVPPKWGVTGWRAYQNRVGDAYVAAIQANDIQYAVLLSSIGAHMGDGAGPVDGLHDVEQKLKTVPGLNAVFLRPSYFMYNLFGMIGIGKRHGRHGRKFWSRPLVLVHNSDIAEAALDELLQLGFTGQRVRYVAGDEHTGAEIAAILGEAIGKPETPWVVFSDEQSKQGALQAGLNEEMATEYTKMGEALRTGAMQADYFANRPATFGKVTLEDFARTEFAPAFNAPA